MSKKKPDRIFSQGNKEKLRELILSDGYFWIVRLLKTEMLDSFLTHVQQKSQAIGVLQSASGSLVCTFSGCARGAATFGDYVRMVGETLISGLSDDPSQEEQLVKFLQEHHGCLFMFSGICESAERETELITQAYDCLLNHK